MKHITRVTPRALILYVFYIVHPLTLSQSIMLFNIDYIDIFYHTLAPVDKIVQIYNDISVFLLLQCMDMFVSQRSSYYADLKFN